MPVNSAAIPAGFSEQDQFLIEKTEEALVNGAELAAWRDGPKPGTRTFPLNLVKKFKLENRAEGYFGHTTIAGRARTIMGATQYVKFSKLDRPDATSILKEFVLKEFLTRAHWTWPSGYPGGFTVEKSLYQRADGSYGKFGPFEANGCIDWRDLVGSGDSGAAGNELYKWVLLTLQIHDFTMGMGPFEKRLREAACVSPAAHFMRVREHPSEACVLSITVGYPFVEFAPIPNIFGFGPGKFGIALKFFTFELMRNGDLNTSMDFLAAPRCEKVFDFGPSIPDPMYGGADLLNKLTMGMYKTEAIHDKMDISMLETHCRVHQSLMDGLSDVWDTWLAGKSIARSA